MQTMQECDTMKIKPLPPLTEALGMYEKVRLIRRYEERIYYLFLEGVMPGTIHQSHGQEACAVGMLNHLGVEDYMTSTHRPAGHCLAKGVDLNAMMAEMFAKTTGCCKAYGGAMHTGDLAVGAVPAIAIVGGGMPLAVGIGLSCKMRKTQNVVVCFFGDGASNEGAFHESLNAASIWDLPVVFACENNLYGASTPVGKVMKVLNVADRAAAYGMPGMIVDGNDVFAVQVAADEAVARARGGGGPTLVELKTYRIGGHSRNDACGYRPKEEAAKWLKREPVKIARERILETYPKAAAQLDDCDQRVEAQLDAAIAFAKASPDPKPEDGLKHVYFGGN
jgi:pyruvate dehydrogenase E1 component alpha subunit